MRDVSMAIRICVAPGVCSLTPEQNAGTVCVWCPAALLPGEGIDLGGSGPWLPHACPACYHAQTAALATYYDWIEHHQQCEPCRTAPCEQSLALRHAAMRAREEAGRPPPLCASCLEAIGPGEGCIPLVWDGNGRPVLSILHTGPCAYPRRGYSVHLPPPAGVDW
ncbi:hypothetical protein GPA10_05345 [Streptomyces sp. p1417]|uniref:Uncharacterized protein n=1 Tax=Streptomyces typhae TaxID=2681492 RepID=A0A6L6WPQ5_9ACTN|nr:hypothetical protein [Streptomyces typhae]MVO84212.1 hypothetical protein [Streptomyces typhae]